MEYTINIIVVVEVGVVDVVVLIVEAVIQE